jgi:hypothetical protein
VLEDREKLADALDMACAPSISISVKVRSSSMSR